MLWLNHFHPEKTRPPLLSTTSVAFALFASLLALFSLACIRTAEPSHPHGRGERFEPYYFEPYGGYMHPRIYPYPYSYPHVYPYPYYGRAPSPGYHPASPPRGPPGKRR